MGELLVAKSGIGPWIAEVADRQPGNPFASPAYCAARVQGGDTPVVFHGRQSLEPVTSLGFLRSGRMTRTFHIPSVPDVGADSPFWPELRAWCRATGVSRLVIDSFASSRAEIPELGPELFRHTRREFTIDLAGPDFDAAISSSHRRRIKQAAKAGITFRTEATRASVDLHVALMRAAHERRTAATAASPFEVDVAPFWHLVEAGAARCFQAVRGADNEVLASALLLLVPKGGYHHSSGSHPDGAECGASHFLFYEAARHLKAQGSATLNLGGVREDESGLRTFKERFGARGVDLVKAGFDFTPPVKRLIRHAAGLLRRVK